MLSSQQPEDHSDDRPGPETAEDLVLLARRLRDGVAAVSQAEEAGPAGPPGPLRRAAWELASRRLEEAGEQLERLRGPLLPDGRTAPGECSGRAEWSLLTDEALWSEEVFRILGRAAGEGPLTLDQLPSCLVPEDQPVLTSAVTRMLIDGRPAECEFRVVRHGARRTVRMAGEPVLDERGSTVALRAVVREADEPPGAGPAGGREGERACTGAGGSRPVADQRVHRALPWPAPGQGGGRTGPGSLDLAAGCLPVGGCSPGDGKWYDAMELPDGSTVLSVGDVSGGGTAAAGNSVALRGALRGICLTGVGPAALLSHLNELLEHHAYPVLAGLVCCRYRAADRTLVWAQAGHPAPVLCGREAGRSVPRPEGTLLGAVPDAVYEERTDRLAPGEVLVLHTDGLFPPAPVVRPATRDRADHRLVTLAPRIAAAGTARGGLRLIVDAGNVLPREDDACVLVARVR